MEISVSGHQVDTGSALQDRAAERLNDIIDKYFNEDRCASSTSSFLLATCPGFTHTSGRSIT